MSCTRKTDEKSVCTCDKFTANFEAVWMCDACGHEDSDHDDFDMPFSGSMERKS